MENEYDNDAKYPTDVEVEKGGGLTVDAAMSRTSLEFPHLSVWFGSLAWASVFLETLSISALMTFLYGGLTHDTRYYWLPFISYLGRLIISPILAVLSDAFLGRRWVAVGTSAVASCAAASLPTSTGMMMIVTGILGGASGTLAAVDTAYQVEMSPRRLRLRSVCLSSLFGSLMSLVVAGVLHGKLSSRISPPVDKSKTVQELNAHYVRMYEILMYVLAGIYALSVFSRFFLGHETPFQLAERGRPADALVEIQSINGGRSVSDDSDALLLSRPLTKYDAVRKATETVLKGALLVLLWVVVEGTIRNYVFYTPLVMLGNLQTCEAGIVGHALAVVGVASLWLLPEAPSRWLRWFSFFAMGTLVCGAIICGVSTVTTGDPYPGPDGEIITPINLAAMKAVMAFYTLAPLFFGPAFALLLGTCAMIFKTRFRATGISIIIAFAQIPPMIWYFISSADRDGIGNLKNVFLVWSTPQYTNFAFIVGACWLSGWFVAAAVGLLWSPAIDDDDFE